MIKLHNDIIDMAKSGKYSIHEELLLIGFGFFLFAAPIFLTSVFFMILLNFLLYFL